jgi:hypothetical protein
MVSQNLPSATIALSGEFCQACAVGIRGFEALVRAGDVGGAVRYIVDAPTAGGRCKEADQFWSFAFVEVSSNRLKSTAGAHR